MKRKNVMRCTLVLLLGCLFTGCATTPAQEDNLILIEKETAPITYEMAAVSIGDVQKTQKLRCSYQQVNDETLSFSISGKRVAEVYVEEGESVVKGQILAELDVGNAQDQIRTLEYNIARNELNLKNSAINEQDEISAVWLRFLFQSGKSAGEQAAVEKNVEGIQQRYRYNREDWEDAIALDKAQLAALQSDLKNSRLVAGMDGTVSDIKEYLEGSTSIRDEEVIKIIDSTECLFEVTDTTWASYFEEGKEVDLSIVSGTGAGEYKLVPHDKENWGEVMLFTLSGNTENVNIGVGASGTIHFSVEERKQVLTVPLKAVHLASGKSYVYVLGEGNMREVKWIETGLFGDETVEVISGLTEGEKVIIK